MNWFLWGRCTQVILTFLPFYSVIHESVFSLSVLYTFKNYFYRYRIGYLKLALYICTIQFFFCYQNMPFCLLELTLSGRKPSCNLNMFHILCLYITVLTEIRLSAKSITPFTASSFSCIPPTLVLEVRNYNQFTPECGFRIITAPPSCKSICSFEHYAICLCQFLQLLSFSHYYFTKYIITPSHLLMMQYLAWLSHLHSKFNHYSGWLTHPNGLYI